MFLSAAGNVGRDAELKMLPSGSAVCNFSFCESGYDFKKKEKTSTWIRVAIFGRRGEQLAGLITKGSKVAVSGEMTLSEYNGKQTIEIKAQDVTLLGGGQPAAARAEPAAREVDASDDIPFD